MAVDDPRRDRAKKFVVRDRIQILRQVGVHHIGEPLAQQSVHRLDRIDAAAARSVAIGSGFEVRLEDRLQHQLRGGLHHAVPNRGDTEWPLTATGLGDHHPSHRLGLVRLGPQFRLDADQPVLQPCRRDRRVAHAINARCALVGAHQSVGMAQYIRAVDLVVEQIEPEVRNCSRAQPRWSGAGLLARASFSVEASSQGGISDMDGKVLGVEVFADPFEALGAFRVGWV